MTESWNHARGSWADAPAAQTCLSTDRSGAHSTMRKSTEHVARACIRKRLFAVTILRFYSIGPTQESHGQVGPWGGRLLARAVVQYRSCQCRLCNECDSQPTTPYIVAYVKHPTRICPGDHSSKFRRTFVALMLITHVSRLFPSCRSQPRGSPRAEVWGSAKGQLALSNTGGGLTLGNKEIICRLLGV